jgi:prepilin peptidase CpaA
MINHISAGLLLVALSVAAYTDIRRRIISNRVILVITILAICHKILSGSHLAGFGTDLLQALIVCIVLIVPYLFYVIGGGDIKLIVALVFYNTASQLLDFLWYMSLGYIITCILMWLWWRKSPPLEQYRNMPLAVPIFLGQVGVFMT